MKLARFDEINLIKFIYKDQLWDRSKFDKYFFKFLLESHFTSHQSKKKILPTSRCEITKAT